MHRRIWFDLDASACVYVTEHIARDDHLARLDVANHKSTDADDYCTGAMHDAFDATINTNGPVGVDVTTDRQSIVDYREPGSRRLVISIPAHPSSCRFADRFARRHFFLCGARQDER